MSKNYSKWALTIIQKDIATIHNGAVRHDAKNVADWLSEYTQINKDNRKCYVN